MKEKLKMLQEKASEAFREAKEIKDVDELKVKYLGKKGELTRLLKDLGRLSAEERPIIGQFANDVRQDIETMLEETKKRLTAAEMERRMEKEKIDVTMPGKAQEMNRTHSISMAKSFCGRRPPRCRCVPWRRASCLFVWSAPVRFTVPMR